MSHGTELLHQFGDESRDLARLARKRGITHDGRPAYDHDGTATIVLSCVAIDAEESQIQIAVGCRYDTGCQCRQPSTIALDGSKVRGVEERSPRSS